ncbi:MAG: sigma-54 dependent transcriptional regulator, partial [Proteobacteria bacterium]|nr:sigma-54 dependent transcriptional regulator [Pseudomonadota bacterium]MBU1610911.1 sigma-54 dependent transcriptional regulator [Pseudomonadota bacterium]
DATPGDIPAMLRHIQATASSPEVIMLSWHCDPDKAEIAIREGAWNYFAKPTSLLRLKVVVERILDKRVRDQNHTTVALKRERIVGHARPLQDCLDQVARAATTESNVLLTGETGTGKELFARAIHANSRRIAGPFIVVDCAALPETLAESMLFGHEKGAFTSAEFRTSGLVREAHLGTLFLDEIGELPPPVQKVFLRVLEYHCFRPVGSTKEVRSDFRLVSATNRDLDHMVEAGDFRRDLLYRLRSMSIELPPLRAITDDMNEITCFYISKISSAQGIPRKGFSPDFLDTLMNYDWPGNVRELINSLERAISMAGDEPILFPRHLPTSIRAKMARFAMARSQPPPKPHAPPPLAATSPPPPPSKVPEQVGSPAAAPLLQPLKEFRAEHLARLERMYLEDLLTSCGDDMRRCLKVSGLSRARFYALLSEHGLRRG